jgi:hypothetical protein
MQPNDGGPLPWNCGREKQAQQKSQSNYRKYSLQPASTSEYVSMNIDSSIHQLVITLITL